MNYKKINEVLKDLNGWNLSKKYTKVSENVPEDFSQEKSQGDTSVKSIVYKLDFDDLYLRVDIESDSYGEGETLTSVQFVKPVQKTITDFEAI